MDNNDPALIIHNSLLKRGHHPLRVFNAWWEFAKKTDMRERGKKIKNCYCDEFVNVGTATANSITFFSEV